MKRFLSIFIVLFSLLSCTPNNPIIIATIQYVSQDHFSNYYGEIGVYSTVVNNGDCNIAMYKIYYEVTYVDGFTYIGTCVGTSYLIMGEERLEYVSLPSSGKKYKDIRIVEVEYMWM